MAAFVYFSEVYLYLVTANKGVNTEQKTGSVVRG